MKEDFFKQEGDIDINSIKTKINSYAVDSIKKDSRQAMSAFFDKMLEFYKNSHVNLSFNPIEFYNQKQEESKDFWMQTFPEDMQNYYNNYKVTASKQDLKEYIKKLI